MLPKPTDQQELTILLLCNWQGNQAFLESHVLVKKRYYDSYKELAELHKELLENIEQRLKKARDCYQSDKPEGSKTGKADGKGRSATAKKV